MFTICIVNVITCISVHEWSINAHRTTTLYVKELRVFLEYKKINPTQKVISGNFSSYKYLVYIITIDLLIT